MDVTHEPGRALRVTRFNVGITVEEGNNNDIRKGVLTPIMEKNGLS